eukprot:NODE_14410_length_1110_cov_10.261445.p1 GENE.NODE_14410_length_1110_cov_10.261445~~NODE_14410_length_1110_cov_10.261445.p1  ORF type:complete len:281 (+),score=79.93 NODE_14410_length_1110_cov_10.261445:120-962(+)
MPPRSSKKDKEPRGSEVATAPGPAEDQAQQEAAAESEANAAAGSNEAPDQLPKSHIKVTASLIKVLQGPAEPPPVEPSTEDAPSEPLLSEVDVQRLLQQAILPTLCPGIEELVQHVCTTGELQLALQRLEQACPPPPTEDEKERRKEVDRERESEREEHKLELARQKDLEREREKAEKRDRRKRKTRIATREKDMEKDLEKVAEEHEQSAAEEATAAMEENAEAASVEEAPPPFNPLEWLANYLRQHAKEPPGQYADQIARRLAETVRQDLEEAAISPST